MLNIPFEVVQVEPAKPWDMTKQGGGTGVSYKANVIIDDVLVALKLTNAIHVALGQQKRGTVLSGEFEVKKDGKAGTPSLVLFAFKAK